MVNYDLTVRDSDGSVVQFRYGEDSLDVCKSQYLKESQLSFLADNRASIMADEKAVPLAKRYTDLEALEAHKKRVKKSRDRLVRRFVRRDSGFLRFCRDRARDMQVEPHSLEPRLKEDFKRTLVSEWHSLKEEGEDEGRGRSYYERKAGRVPDPTVSAFRPDSNFGAVSEKVEDMIESYLGQGGACAAGVDDESFRVRERREIVSSKKVV